MLSNTAGTRKQEEGEGNLLALTAVGVEKKKNHPAGHVRHQAVKDAITALSAEQPDLAPSIGEALTFSNAPPRPGSLRPRLLASQFSFVG